MENSKPKGSKEEEKQKLNLTRIHKATWRAMK